MPKSSLHYVLASLSCILLVLLAYSYYPFYTDDALISLQYVKRFLQGDGLTWTDGERVEGYSNFLWIVIVAAVGKFGFDLICVTRVLGTAFMVLALLAIFYRAEKTSALVFGALCFLAYGPVGAWAVGGLEQPLLTACVLWGTVYAARNEPRDQWRASVLFALATVTRSDGILFPFAVASGLILLSNHDSWTERVRASQKLLVLPVLFLVAQTLFRLGYYGEWVSNIAHLKIAVSLDRLWYGLRYVARGYSLLFPFSILGGIGAVWFWRYRPDCVLLRLCAVQTMLWTAYLVFIGGDVNPPSRHFVPLAGLVAMILKVSCSCFADRCKQQSKNFPILAPVICSIVFLSIQFLDAENRWARRMRGTQSCAEVSLLMKRHFKALDPLLAVDSAGCYPYWSELRSLDLLGLNDKTIARSHPADYGEGWIGHEAGNGAYVFERKPDILAFCGYAGADAACWRSGKEMQDDPRFRKLYKLSRFNVRTLDSIEARLWIRIEGPLGVAKRGNEVTLPIYYLDRDRWPVLVEENQNGFEVEIRDGDMVRIPTELLENGVWSMTSEGDSGFCIVHGDKKFSIGEGSRILVDGDKESYFITRCNADSGRLGNIRLIQSVPKEDP